ncbi:hypothetical protein BM43_3191 [Burkholderia gladioli]|uniref:hypothetical protein n=1 Tax=Burkholderia gladioli TaxID=28095 RepID=UPI0005A77B44|nr:hypothetical protein [Burkholderia gladioli]AJW99392.1 hypothetical protein BM43_3191 [Burkholderia gladioli]ASD79147.1 hypothetical protein CEJ98_09085 [Burkholderia gladioli pv. gladioli]AWY55612.1 hypothetical protein A8H28_32075 [Burkholderia gladioli pv. gladioli]SPU87700.1 Uncharacterised protein [Burkholderia gladioli]
MRLTFIIPADFTVYGVPQRERPPCVIELQVVELIRMTTKTRSPWSHRFTRRTKPWISFMAYAHLPGWISAPERWRRAPGGAVLLDVPVHFNRRVTFPEFPESGRLSFESNGEDK